MIDFGFRLILNNDSNLTTFISFKDNNKRELLSVSSFHPLERKQYPLFDSLNLSMFFFMNKLAYSPKCRVEIPKHRMHCLVNSSM